jgi:hypothetical protein
MGRTERDKRLMGATIRTRPTVAPAVRNLAPPPRVVDMTIAPQERAEALWCRRSRCTSSSAVRMKRPATSEGDHAEGDHARTSELLLFKDVFEAPLLASVPDADHFHEGEGWRTCDTPATREGQASVGSPHGGESSPLASDKAVVLLNAFFDALEFLKASCRVGLLHGPQSSAAIQLALRGRCAMDGRRAHRAKPAVRGGL